MSGSGPATRRGPRAAFPRVGRWPALAPLLHHDREEPNWPDLVICLELPEGLLVGQSLVMPEDREGAVARGLRNALTQPAAGSPRRPDVWKWQPEKGPLWPREKGPPEARSVAWNRTPGAPGAPRPTAPSARQGMTSFSCERDLGTGQLKSTTSGAGGTTQLGPVYRAKPRGSRAAAGQHSRLYGDEAGDDASRRRRSGLPTTSPRSIRSGVFGRASPLAP